MVGLGHIGVHGGNPRIILVNNVVRLLRHAGRPMDHLQARILSVIFMNLSRHTVAMANLLVHSVLVHMMAKIGERGSSVHRMAVG